jgi:glycosyltransferase involved in cell wall biosynthesis
LAGKALILVENLSVPFDRRVWQESTALRDAGWKVHVICPRGTDRDTEPEIELDGVKIYRYPLGAAVGGPAGYLREYGWALWQTHRLARKVGPVDVVHACNPPDLFYLLARRLKRRGARFVFDQHDLVPELYLSRFGRGKDFLYRVVCRLERRTYQTADIVIATNESYRRAAISRGGKRPEDVYVVRSAPAVERFRQVPVDGSIRRGKPYLLCYLGVMGPQDGVDYALRALAKLRYELGRTDWHAAFVGAGDTFDAMRELAGELKLSDSVDFTGRIPDEDLMRYLSTADVCLAPDPLNPLNDVSTMNKIMEYMAMARPIVSFELREARVSAGDAAVYAPANDEMEFARLVAELLDDPERRQRMGALGLARVTGPLSWVHSRAALVAAYDAAMARSSGRRAVGQVAEPAGWSGRGGAGQPAAGVAAPGYGVPAAQPCQPVVEHGDRQVAGAVKHTDVAIPRQRQKVTQLEPIPGHGLAEGGELPVTQPHPYPPVEIGGDGAGRPD